jgi:hypothetical protein
MLIYPFVSTGVNDGKYGDRVAEQPVTFPENSSTRYPVPIRVVPDSGTPSSGYADLQLPPYLTGPGRQGKDTRKKKTS